MVLHKKSPKRNLTLSSPYFLRSLNRGKNVSTAIPAAPAPTSENNVPSSTPVNSRCACENQSDINKVKKKNYTSQIKRTSHMPLAPSSESDSESDQQDKDDDMYEEHSNSYRGVSPNKPEKDDEINNSEPLNRIIYWSITRKTQPEKSESTAINHGEMEDVAMDQDPFQDYEDYLSAQNTSEDEMVQETLLSDQNDLSMESADDDDEEESESQDPAIYWSNIPATGSKQPEQLAAHHDKKFRRCSKKGKREQRNKKYKVKRCKRCGTVYQSSSLVRTRKQSKPHSRNQKQSGSSKPRKCKKKSQSEKTSSSSASNDKQGRSKSKSSKSSGKRNGSGSKKGTSAKGSSSKSRGDRNRSTNSNKTGKQSGSRSSRGKREPSKSKSLKSGGKQSGTGSKKSKSGIGSTSKPKGDRSKSSSKGKNEKTERSRNAKRDRSKSSSSKSGGKPSGSEGKKADRSQGPDPKRSRSKGSDKEARSSKKGTSGEKSEQSECVTTTRNFTEPPEMPRIVDAVIIGLPIIMLLLFI